MDGLEDPDLLLLTEADMRPSGRGKGRIAREQDGRAVDGRKLDLLAREVDQVAEYVNRLKREIRSLKAADVASKRVPATIDDLRSVREATRSAADTIMAAAETILAQSPSDPAYPRLVTDRVTEIIQACSFEDLAGQRLDRAVDTLRDVEQRLGRFARAVKIADAAERFDRQAIMKQARREVLLVEGPQNDGAGIAQSDVDKLFG